MGVHRDHVRQRGIGVLLGLVLDEDNTRGQSGGADVLGAYAAAFRSFVHARGLPSLRPAERDFWGAVDRVPAEAFTGALQRSIELSGDTLIGLRFAREIEFGRFGLLGIVAAMAPDLRGALTTLLHCKAAMSRLGAAHIVSEGEFVDIVWCPNDGVPACVGETVLAGWLNFARHITAQSIPVEQVALPVMSAARREAVQELVQASVRTDAGHGRLRIRRNVLEAPSRFGSSELYAKLFPWLQREAQLLSYDVSGSLLQVRQGMLGLWQSEGGVSESALAERLGVSRRSLQRRLARHQVSFRELHDTLRVSAGASGLVARPARQMEVGERLGFAEQSSFSRSMRAWIGAPPSELFAWAHSSGGGT